LHIYNYEEKNSKYQPHIDLFPILYANQYFLYQQ